MREDWPLSPIEVRQPGLHESLESIWSAPHNIAAELLIEQLRVRGVKASLMTEDVTEQIGGVVARYTKFSVGVYTEDLELAQHIVRRFEITDA